MNEFNTYLNDLDYSLIKDLCERKGKLQTYRKGAIFLSVSMKKSVLRDGWKMEPFNIPILTKREKNTL